MLDLLKDILPVSFDILLILLVVYIILLPFIASWKLFKKVGIQGWKALIPVYNVYLMFKIVGMPAIVCTIPYVAYSVLDAIYSEYDKAPKPALIAIIVVLIIYLVVDIIKNIKLGKVFGKSKKFIVGLVLLTPIFEIILGMGKSKYIGDYKVKE